MITLLIKSQINLFDDSKGRQMLKTKRIYK